MANRIIYTVVPTTGNTVAVPNGFDYLNIQPAGTLSTLTVNPPAGANNGDLFTIFSTQIVTTLTMSAASGSNQTIVGAATALTANGIGGRWVFIGPTQTWQPV